MNAQEIQALATLPIGEHIKLIFHAANARGGNLVSVDTKNQTVTIVNGGRWVPNVLTGTSSYEGEETTTYSFSKIKTWKKYW